MMELCRVSSVDIVTFLQHFSCLFAGKKSLLFSLIAHILTCTLVVTDRWRVKMRVEMFRKCLENHNALWNIKLIILKQIFSKADLNFLSKLFLQQKLLWRLNLLLWRLVAARRYRYTGTWLKDCFCTVW